MNDAQSALSLNWSREALARERGQTEESQYYEEHKGCLYGPEIVD